MIVVIGATGNTGNAAAGRLLDAGTKVRAIGRTAERLAPLTARGAEAAIGTVTDAAFLTTALRGADAVYAMVPPEYNAPDLLAVYDKVGEALVRALDAAGTRRVVFLSSLGAELPAGTGPIVGLRGVEQRLKALPEIDLLILRPGYFFENHFGSLGLIKAQGVNGGAIAPHVTFPQIATRDIGAVAADALLQGDFKGAVVRELLGPRDLSMAEATRIIGAKIGKPHLEYVQFPDDAFIGGLVQAGFSKGVAQLFVEMAQAINAGKVRSLEGRNARNSTPTAFESFADSLAQAYRAM